jgi:FdrA protein
MILKTGAAPNIGVLLLDLVLGKGSHPDPAEPMMTAFSEAQKIAENDGRQLYAVASVIGTESDPQNLSKQTAKLAAAGIEVLATNAEAARFAALLVKPEIRDELLENWR